MIEQVGFHKARTINLIYWSTTKQWVGYTVIEWEKQSNQSEFMGSMYKRLKITILKQVIMDGTSPDIEVVTWPYNTVGMNRPLVAVTALITQPISSPNPLFHHPRMFPVSPGGSSTQPTPTSRAILWRSSSASSRYVTRCRMVGRQVALSHRTDGNSKRMHNSATRFSS